MVNVKKIIACLYSGIVAASAMEDITNLQTLDSVMDGSLPTLDSILYNDELPKVVKFDGNETVKGCKYIKFKQTSDPDNITIWKLEIDELALLNEIVWKNCDPQNAVEDVTLVIPAMVNGKQIFVQRMAFSGLTLVNSSADYLRLSLMFEKVDDGNVERGVIFPEDSSFMFYDSNAIVFLDLSGVDVSRIRNVGHMFLCSENIKKRYNYPDEGERIIYGNFREI